MKKIIALTLTLFCLTSCSGMKEKIQKVLNGTAEAESVEGTKKREGAKLCVFGSMDEKPVLWVDGKQVILSDAGKKLSMEDASGTTLAALADDNDIYALCYQDKKLVLYSNNTATILDDNVWYAGAAQILVQDGKPVAYISVSDDKGNFTVCRYYDGLKSTIVDSKVLEGFMIRNLTVHDGKLYGTANTMSQFGEAAVLVEGRITQLEPVWSDAHKVIVDGANVVVCGRRCTDPDGFSDAEEAENPSAAALWRNGKAENLEANSEAVAYAKDGNDEYVLLVSSGDYDEEQGTFGNMRCTLWKNGKQTEVITEEQYIKIPLLSIDGGKVTIVVDESTSGEQPSYNVFVWRDGKKETIYSGLKETNIIGANF